MASKEQAIEVVANFVANEVAEQIVSALEQAGMVTFKEYGNHDVNDVLEAFKLAFGTTKSSRYDRYAATRLIKRHGAETVMVAIGGLANGQGERFCPNVNSVSQLEEKWPSVVRFLRARWEGAKEIEL